MKKTFSLLMMLGLMTTALSQTNPKTIKKIKQTVCYLASDRLEGRRTGTEGERLAYEYIQKEYRKAGLMTILENNSYIQPFEVKEGRTIGSETNLKILGRNLETNTDYFPFAFSGNCNNLFLASVWNDDRIVLTDLKEALELNKTNPHFDGKEYIIDISKKAIEGKKSLVIVYNSSENKDSLFFDSKDKTTPLNIPVVYFTRKTIDEIKNMSTIKAVPCNLTINIAEKSSIGHNVVGYINNGAAYTVVVGAHYDHLGYGQDHNSLYTGTTPMIHNGADDNASGTAAMIAMAKHLRKKSYRAFNYLFVAFSGEELGLFGSKYFTEHTPVELKKINYMVNMDMVGRLNDSTRGITIGGYGTSPAWGKLIDVHDRLFTIKIDSAGSGPSDHTSFYRKELPVLFFFTGTHSDYHKPSDDAEKINYKGTGDIVQYILSIIKTTTQQEKLVFTKTREAANTGKNSFKVTMGIMPDYTFSGIGVLVDGISEGRPAQKAGIRVGDIVLQLGEYPVQDVQSYMQVLNKFNKGNETVVKIKRGAETIEVKITF
jgi:hypothetical protein